MKIIFWGTSEFALAPLGALLSHGYHIGAIVTNPDQPVGRKHVLTPPPVKTYATKHAIGMLQPIRPEFIENELRGLAPDLFIVAAYGKILPKEILEIPKYGAFNIHPSLLPRWRGPSPIQYAILSGDAETGVTIIQMDEEMDHGPIIASHKLQVINSKATYKELHDQLSSIGAELLVEILPKWLGDQITPAPQPQDDAKATYSKILAKEDGKINWSKPAEEIERMIRAFNPWPGTWTTWIHNAKSLRVRIEEASCTPDVPPHGEPGLVWQDVAGLLLVKTGRGNLVIKKLTLEGKRAIGPDEFLRGHPDFIGAILG